MFRRYSYCRRKVESIPGTGKKVQDVWSKEWRWDTDRDKIKMRKAVGVRLRPGNMSSDEYAKYKREL